MLRAVVSSARAARLNARRDMATGAVPATSALFEAQADLYKLYRPEYPAEIYERLMRHHAAHGSGHTDCCVDLATGSGQAIGPLAALFKQVIGIDGSPAQIAQAKAPSSNVSFRLGTAEATGLPSASADVVTVAQAYHWFATPTFWKEVHRVLKPGGTVAVWGYADAALPDSPAASAALDAHYNAPPLGPFWDERRALLDNLYRGLDPPSALFGAFARHEDVALEKAMPPDALVAYTRTWSAHAAALRATGAAPGSPEDPAVVFEAALKRALGSDPPPLLRVVWPTVLLLGVRRGPPAV